MVVSDSMRFRSESFPEAAGKKSPDSNEENETTCNRVKCLASLSPPCSSLFASKAFSLDLEIKEVDIVYQRFVGTL